MEIKEKERVFGLDFVRAIAIFFVLLAHGRILPSNGISEFIKFRLLDGVELFFVLSGFLIGTILFEQFNSKSSNRDLLFTFYKRRWLRTLPLYFFILCVNILLVTLGISGSNDASQLWKYLFFLQNFYTPIPNFFLESWSLTVEEWFYLIFPIAIICFSKIVSKSGILKFHFLFLILLFIIAPFSLRLLFLHKENYWFGERFIGIVVFKLDSIGFGLFAAFLKFFWFKKWEKYRYLFLLAGLVVVYFSWFSPPSNATLAKIICPSLLCIGYAFTLPFFDSWKRSDFLISKWITLTSKISYSLYLTNLTISLNILLFFFKIDTIEKSWLTYLLYWIITYFVSYLLYRWIEQPFQKIYKSESLAIPNL